MTPPEVDTKVRILQVEGHEIKGIFGPLAFEKVQGKVGNFIGVMQNGRWCVDFGNIGPTPLPFTVDVEPGDLEIA